MTQGRALFGRRANAFWTNGTAPLVLFPPFDYRCIAHGEHTRTFSPANEAMPADYVSRIRQLGWPGLRELWSRIERGAATGWPPGKALEHLVLRAFELSGATVRWPYPVSVGEETVEQIDGAVHVGGLSCIVECKDTVEATNTDAIAKLRNQLLRRPAGVIGLMFSRAGFTPSAVVLADFMAPQCILPWDGEEIAYMLEKENCTLVLVAKYRRSIEHGSTRDFDIRQEVSV